jgi:hypothetical protein
MFFIKSTDWNVFELLDKRCTVSGTMNKLHTWRFARVLEGAGDIDMFCLYKWY